MKTGDGGANLPLYPLPSPLRGEGNAGRTYLRTATWLMNFPGMAIMVTVMSINLLGDGLRDVLDPRLKTF